MFTAPPKLLAHVLPTKHRVTYQKNINSLLPALKQVNLWAYAEHISLTVLIKWI